MSETPTRSERDPLRPRANRHRPQIDPAPAPAAAPAPVPAPERPAPPVARPARPVPAPTPLRDVHDQTRAALRKPAHLSERCAGCGAPTRGRSRMVTELVDVGPVRALRVVACSACPDRRRRDALV